MDFLSLFAAGKILGLKLSLPRLILSSALGALYCIFTFFYDSEKIIIPEIVLNVAMSVVMCFIAYNVDSLIKFTKIFVIFYSACFMLGGGIEALYYLSGFIKTEDISDLRLNIPSLQGIIILAGICVFIIILAGSLFKRGADRFLIKETEIIVGFMGKEVKLKAIVDSGNLVRDPISSLPVIIVKLGSIADLFDMKMLEFFIYDSPSYLNGLCGEKFTAKYDLNDLHASNELNCLNNLNNLKVLKFRLVPVKSVAGANSILPAFSPDYIKCINYAKYKKVKSNKAKDEDIKDINKKDKIYKNRKVFDINAIIAVDSGKADEKYGEKYGGIMPAALMEK